LVEKNINLTNNQVRMFYAALYGDLLTVQKLDAAGVSVNVKDFDGRTPLHVAASEGYLDIVKYLVARDADISLKDTRGNDPRLDAIREGREVVYELLNSVKSNLIIKEQCKIFSKGIFSNGMASAIAAYHKKFEDI
jgi:glutaminase